MTAQAARERFEVAKPVLKRDSESIRCKRFFKLSCDEFRLPGFDQDKRMFDTAAFTCITNRMNFILMFIACCIHQARAMPAQSLQPCLP